VLILSIMSKASKRIDASDPIAPATSRRMARTAQRDNRGERALRSELHRRGLRFRLHRPIVQGTRRTADVVFAGAKLAVFVDGCFWHGCPAHGTRPKNNAAWWRAKIAANMARDRDTDSRLEALGWTVVRVWAHEDPVAAADRIEAIARRSD